jgi:hypothetical protein
MKQIVFLALTIFISFAQVNAQKNNSKVEMAFDKTADGITAHDFGSIVFGANGKVDFTYTNKGTKPITITNVESSCNCTVPTWTKEPVLPGKQGTVTVVYNTKLGGVFNKTIVVTSNANNSPVRLEIRGKVNVKPSEIPAATAATAPKGSDAADAGTKLLPGQKTGQTGVVGQTTTPVKK